MNSYGGLPDVVQLDSIEDGTDQRGGVSLKQGGTICFPIWHIISWRPVFQDPRIPQTESNFCELYQAALSAMSP